MAVLMSQRGFSGWCKRISPRVTLSTISQPLLLLIRSSMDHILETIRKNHAHSAAQAKKMCLIAT
jgi:hypothetical protein